MGVGACIHVYHGCGYLYSDVLWVWVLASRCTMDVSTYAGVPWVRGLVYKCTMGVGACIHVYHGCGCLYTHVITGVGTYTGIPWV